MKKVIKHMKIVLLKDIPNLGQKGDVKQVRPGFARNFLVPQNLAALPNDDRAKEIIGQRFLKQKEKRKQKEELDQKIKELTSQKIIFSVKVNKKGHLFRSIKAKDIAQKIQLAEELIKTTPIKTLGKHQISILLGDKEIPIFVVVEAEK